MFLNVGLKKSYHSGKEGPGVRGLKVGDMWEKTGKGK